MNDGEKAGRWAVVYLLVVLITVWWTVVCIVWFHIKEWIYD